jgi:hypothetical protein
MRQTGFHIAPGTENQANISFTNVIALIAHFAIKF